MSKIAKGLKSWDRQNRESDKAYSAFKIYLEMENRSLQKVAESLQKDATLIRRWASKFQWRERANAYDYSIIEETRKARISQRKKDLIRQDKIGQLLLQKAVEVLRNADTKKASFYAATQMANLGCNLINESFKLNESEQRNEKNFVENSNVSDLDFSRLSDGELNELEKIFSKLSAEQ